jgi:hypothetical protein
MNMIQSAFYPRKIRKVVTGGKAQHLISVPRSIAERYQDSLFTCTTENGKIVFTPITQEASDAA